MFNPLPQDKVIAELQGFYLHKDQVDVAIDALMQIEPNAGDCGNCFEGTSDMDHICRKCGGADKHAQCTEPESPGKKSVAAESNLFPCNG